MHRFVLLALYCFALVGCLDGPLTMFSNQAGGLPPGGNPNTPHAPQPNGGKYAFGTPCARNGDCASGNCSQQTHTCADAPHCLNGTLDWATGGETDIDCGGLDCHPCVQYSRCQVGTDCAPTLDVATGQSISYCVPRGAAWHSSRCVSYCGNGIADLVRFPLNGLDHTRNETDIDCGGTACAPCADGKHCNADYDCASWRCTNSVCQPWQQPSCSDGMLGVGESDVDCGGTCAADPGIGPFMIYYLCDTGQACRANADCITTTNDLNFCYRGTCQPGFRACNDKVRNGSETDVDCGGPMNGTPGYCAPCQNGKRCVFHSDCQSLSCMGGVCSPCGPGLTSCGNQCVDTQTNASHCGACGRMCDPNTTPYCAAGLCTNLIPAGLPCPQGVSAQCQSNYCSSQLICTNKQPGAPCGVNGDCLSQMCTMGRCL